MTETTKTKLERAINALRISQKSIAKDIDGAVAWNDYRTSKQCVRENVTILYAITELKTLLKQA